MNDLNDTQSPVAAPAAGAPAPAPAAHDPLAIFASTSAESEGVLVEVEHPKTGEVLMGWRIARFGGVNNPAIIREERKRKAKLPQGVRRQIDVGGGDPEVVQRLNRQVFVAVSVLGWEFKDTTLAARWGDYTPEKAEQMLEAYPRMYDLLSEKAVDEETFATDQLEDDLGNSASA